MRVPAINSKKGPSLGTSNWPKDRKINFLPTVLYSHPRIFHLITFAPQALQKAHSRVVVVFILFSPLINDKIISVQYGAI